MGRVMLWMCLGQGWKKVLHQGSAFLCAKYEVSIYLEKRELYLFTFFQFVDRKI